MGSGKYSQGPLIYPLYCDCGFTQFSPPCNGTDFKPCPCHPPAVPQATVLKNDDGTCTTVNYVILWPSEKRDL